MTKQEFINSLSQNNPPDSIRAELLALWYDKKDNWHRAHQIAQEIPSFSGSWIHAYLHRKEGDEWNAGYWYRRANQPFPRHSLDQEWELLVNAFLN